MLRTVTNTLSNYSLFSWKALIFRVFCRHFGFAADWENWGENDRMSEGVGGGEGKIKFFFSPPLPQFFFFPPTLGKLFTSPQLSTVFLFQDGGLNIRWKYISTRPAKIRLHCRLITCLILLPRWLKQLIQRHKKSITSTTRSTPVRLVECIREQFNDQEISAWSTEVISQSWSTATVKQYNPARRALCT